MKRTLGAALAVLSGAAVALCAGQAAAMNLSIDDATIDEFGDLSLDISEIFLPQRSEVGYIGSARALATFVCVDHRGQPLGGPRGQRIASIPVDDARLARADVRGNVRTTLTLRVQDHMPEIDCPGRSYAQLARIQYTNILVQRPGAFTTGRTVSRDFIPTVRVRIDRGR
ncbi:hypothetical protein [Polyangium jinanense]|uniref:Uncharacterized protein n=1 Tax=Polyangium jinanense TaxID=2829994 RepID=A0A9X3X4M1_9BACT|nr:hypothetical protein [Polyangium jinanense]MDC3954889.1 hypothetical protein [Polyangium jinanense]MDC3981341.1 hypothetical protein [Polyangium jinanense]